MASGPITSWYIDRKTVETVTDFILGGSKITANGDCSHEIKRRLLLGRKVMTDLDSILKSRGITLPTKVHLVKTMIFPVVMYGCESWTLKKVKGCCWTIRCQDSWPPEETNSIRGPETRLDCSELLCNKVLLKYKGDRESFWHRHQKGAERVPSC